MFHFVKKPDQPESVELGEGAYVEDKSKGYINGKPVYVNEVKNLFLGALPYSSWCITYLTYFEEVQSTQGIYGGLFFGGGETPADNSWTEFTVLEQEGYFFVTKPGAESYGNCDGNYVLDKTLGQINGKPVYVNVPKGRFLAAEPNTGWAVTSLDYFEEIQEAQGAFGSYDSTSTIDPEDGDWTYYDVSKFGPIDESLYAESAWEKLENQNVSYQSVGTSSVVRTEDDFEAARKHCIDINCGGFSWRKPHYNQFGEEDDPPICFFYRKTQDELRQGLYSSTDFDFYLAPEEFIPDTSFVPYRDPAPACHTRWIVDKPVYSFACQVVVPEATAYTYYCTTAFHCGYSGIQQHVDPKKWILFSIWNDTTADAKVETIFVRSDMTAQEFGGEGMGMQSFGISGDSTSSKDCPLAAWQPGVPYTFVVRAFSATDGTEFACYFYNPDYGWQLLTRFLRPDTDLDLRGKLTDLYSFIEDFGKNTLRRSARYAGWIQYDTDSEWEPITNIVGTSSAEASEPNKSVRLVSEGSYQVVEMISGGEALEDYSLYSGPIENPLPVPDILSELPPP